VTDAPDPDALHAKGERASRKNAAREVVGGLGIILSLYGWGSLLYRLLATSSYSLDLGWEEYVPDLKLSGTLVGLGTAGLLFGMRPIPQALMATGLIAVAVAGIFAVIILFAIALVWFAG
jgi:hypothetical protein